MLVLFFGQQPEPEEEEEVAFEQAHKLEHEVETPASQCSRVSKQKVRKNN